MYTHFYADSRLDSYIDAVPSYKGKLKLQLNTFEKDRDDTGNRLILTDGKNLFVDALTEIICIKDNCKILWRHPKWYGSKMVLNNGDIFFQSPERKDDMEAVDATNKITLQNFPIPGVIDESFLLLFEPDKKGLYAQVQYAELPEVSVPEYIVYRSDAGSISYTWYQRYVNQICPAIPLVNFKNDFLLTYSPSEGQIYKLSGKKGEAKADFKFNLPEKYDTIFASSSDDGDIFLVWSYRNTITLKCFNSKAEEKYQVKTENDFLGKSLVVSPPVVTSEGYIFILSGNGIFCIHDKKIVWSSKIQFAEYATAFKDNSVIIAAGNILLHFNATGKEIFRYEVKDSITAPVILNSDGGLVFCTHHSVYFLD